MSGSASTLTGSTHTMAMFHPFTGASAPYVKPKQGTAEVFEAHGRPVMGVPLAIDIRTKEVIYIDPWILKDAGIINTCYGIVLGPIGWGKSSLMKILSHRLSLLSAGYDMLRVQINDYKPEGDSSEYLKFAEYMESDSFVIGFMRVNPFESRLFKIPGKRTYSLGVMRMAELICEFVNKTPLIGINAEALRVSVAKMLTYDEALWSMQLLSACAGSLSYYDMVRYYSDVRATLLAQLEEAKDRVLQPGVDLDVATELQRQIVSVSEFDFNIREEDLAQAGVYVQTLINNIINGSMGHLFGNDHSLYDMLKQRATNLDWRGVTQDAETLMRIILSEIKIVAIESNRIDLLPHIEIDDEKHKAMANLVYAKTNAYLGEIARSTHTCNLSATHRLNSIRKGGVGSELYQLGETIINNLGFQAIGRHENDRVALDELTERYGLTPRDRQIIPSLPRYVFGFRFGQQRIRYGKVFAIKNELDFLATNSATGRMLDRPTLIDANTLRMFAEKNGAVFLGMDEAA